MNRCLRHQAAGNSNEHHRRKNRRRGRRRGRRKEGISTGARSSGHSQSQLTISSPVEERRRVPTRLQERLDELTNEERQGVAKLLGYRKIGKSVPKNVSVMDVIKTFPPQVYELDYWRAWGALALTTSSLILGFTCIVCAPWYLLPLAWFMTGTAGTGLFVLGHDCGHHVFHKKGWVNDAVGHLVMTPLLYPYEPWKIMHNLHHAHTNKLNKDTGWHPIMRNETEEGTFEYGILKLVMGTPLKLWLSIIHWVKLHFNPSNYNSNQIGKVRVSWLACFGFATIVWSALIANLGLAGWANFWLMPWLVYHFWMSTFTLVHHTAPHIPFQREDNYHAANAKLGGTVHCDFPRWVEVLCHDINVHVPHHLSARIPFYHLRTATDYLRKEWGQYMTECSFNWRLMRNFFTEIHLYDVGKEYVAFDDGKGEDFLLAAQRRIYPDTM